jgi:hypothetical protein
MPFDKLGKYSIGNLSQEEREEMNNVHSWGRNFVDRAGLIWLCPRFLFELHIQIFSAYLKANTIKMKVKR